MHFQCIVVELMFHDEIEFKTPMSMTQNGGLALFLKDLSGLIAQDHEPWEITIVGHSMGTIVANHIIRDFGDKLPINTVLYLAAAATIEDYETTIYPWLVKDPKHHIYHFTLHPGAEQGEKAFADLPPRGSLLVWIDNFLSKPLSPMQRTVGQLNNLLPALHHADAYGTYRSLRSQISLRTTIPAKLKTPRYIAM